MRKMSYMEPKQIQGRQMGEQRVGRQVRGRKPTCPKVCISRGGLSANEVLCRLNRCMIFAITGAKQPIQRSNTHTIVSEIVNNLNVMLCVGRNFRLAAEQRGNPRLCGC